MRFILLVALFVSSVLAGQYTSQDSTVTLTQRARAGQWVPQMQPPYTWMDTVNLNTDTAYTVPDTVRVCEVRFLKPGNYSMRLSRSGYRPYIADSCDILRADLRNMRKGATDSLCRFGSIRLFGFIK
jgi:hypothetical protein